MSKFDYFAASCLVVLLGIGAKVLLRSEPTQDEVNALKVTMPALVKVDFARLVGGSSGPDGVQWTNAFVLHTEPPYEDWYGISGKHSLKINVVAQRQDGAKFSATYRVALDNRECAKKPESCASLSALTALAKRDDQVL